MGTCTDYTVEQIKEKFAEFELYIPVCTLNNGVTEVNSITLGEYTFDKNYELNLSIGNDNHIVDRGFYVNNGILYVAYPIMAFESINEKQILVDGVSYDITGVDETVLGDLTIESVAYQNGASSVITPVEGTNGAYNATVKEGDKGVKIVYADADADDVILIRTVSDGKIYYSYTLPDSVDGQNVLLLYIVTYTTNPAEIADKFNNATVTYYTYIAGKGFNEMTINITLDIAE